jgi:hypothetical protein
MADKSKKKKKKNKRSSEQLHRQVQDSLQALPKYIEMQKKEGRQARAFFLRYFSAPMLRVMNRVLNAGRYRGKEGEKKRQSEEMKRRLQHKKAAIQHYQGEMQKAQRRRGRPM